MSDILKVWDEGTSSWVGIPAITGPGVPSGGSTGQALVKQSGTDYDTAFGTLGIAGGGTGATTAANALTNLGALAALGTVSAWKNEAAFDLNDFHNGIILCGPNCTNIPTADWWVIVSAGAERAYQYAFKFDNSTSAKVRYRLPGTTPTYTAWTAANTNTYQSGETLDLGGVFCGITNTAGKSFTISIVLPKKLPSSLTISHNLSVNWVRSNGAQATGWSITSISRLTDNILQIVLDSSTAIGAMVSAFVAFNTGTITFS